MNSQRAAMRLPCIAALILLVFAVSLHPAFAAEKRVDNNGAPPGAGALCRLLATRAGVYFVGDATNTFNLLH